MQDSRNNFFRMGRPGIAKFLGTLEATVLEKLWSLQQATVKELQEKLNSDGKPCAYTTILSVLQHLERKGLVGAVKQNKKNIYRPLLSKKKFLAERVNGTLNSLITDFPHMVASYLLGKEEKITATQLKKLKDFLQNR